MSSTEVMSRDIMPSDGTISTNLAVLQKQDSKLSNEISKVFSCILVRLKEKPCLYWFKTNIMQKQGTRIRLEPASTWRITIKVNEYLTLTNDQCRLIWLIQNYMASHQLSVTA